MRPSYFLGFPKYLSLFLWPLLAFSQSSQIQVGQGAPSPSVAEEFIQAFNRGDFFSAVALPPLGQVAAYGSGGYRQEFQDAARSGLRFALIRPASPNLSAGLNNTVRQVRPPITAVLGRSSIGVSVAGFPTMDTADFLFQPSGENAPRPGGSYQFFDKNFAIFVWSNPPLANEGGTEVEMTIADPVYSKWQTVSYAVLGPPVDNLISVTSRFTTKANYQRFNNGAIYIITSGSFSGRSIFVRKNVLDLYLANLGPAGFLGLPLSDETLLADGRRRQTFEGGTVEYALNGTPVLKNAISAISIAGENPLRLSAGQTYPLVANLQTSAGEQVEDREVFWTSSNGLVATVAGTGPRATLRALRGGTVVITATSEGKTSRSLTVFVSGVCCAIGEGAPSQTLSQTFIDAIQRNRLAIRLPIATPVRRLGAGYTQDMLLLGTGARVLAAKPDSAPLAFVVSGNLLSAYTGNGGPAGALGYPLSDASPAGTQLFEFAALAGSPLQIVSGAILARWRALGLEVGALGPPQSSAQSLLTFSGNTVSLQRFTGGVLVQYNSGSLSGRAFVVNGPIGAKYAEIGLAGGLAGAPLSDEFQSAGVFRQEFEGATLEYTQGTPVRVLEKPRRPVLTVTPSAVLPGGRYRVAIGGFPVNARLRVALAGSITDSFEALSASGAYVYESVAPANARSGAVVLRATDLASAQNFAESSFSIRTLPELRPQLSKLSGDLQSSAPATLLGAPLRVLLRDAAGNPLPSIPVRFEASPGGVIVSADRATNADGIAEATWRLPPQAGIALLSVQAAEQTTTFSARSVAASIASYPRLSQLLDGNLGNSSLPLSRKGSLLASLAALLRFYQQRGVVPLDAGLADVNLLNQYLRSYCTLDAGGAQICDGFLDSGSGTDPFPNPLRVGNFSSGVLDFSPLEPNLDLIRQSIVADHPVILALSLTRPGQAPAAHFVTAVGIEANGDLTVLDANPDLARSTLQQYLQGYTIAGLPWTVQLVSAFRYLPRGAQSSAFSLHSAAAFSVSSAAPSCSPVLRWPAAYADLASAPAPGNFYLATCDGAGNAYQVDVPGPFLLSFTTYANPPRRTIVSGAAPASYSIQPENENWSLSPLSLNLSSAAVLNSASFQPQLAPGALISLFGSGLPKSDGQVEWNGQPLPVFFSNGFQLNTSLPESAAPGSGTLRVVSDAGEQSLTLELNDVAPAIFQLPGGAGAIVNQDASLNTSLTPAIRGQAVVIYCTGLGRTIPGSGSLRNSALPVTVLVQNQELRPFFAGLTPGFVGLYQVNVTLPPSLTPGLGQSIGLRQGNLSSPFVPFSLR